MQATSLMATSPKAQLPTSSARLGDPQELAKGVPKPWQVVFSKSRQKYYYYNPDTAVSCWDRPASWVPSGDQTPAAEGGNTPGGQPPAAAPVDFLQEEDANVGLPPNWRAVYSSSRKKYYYYNHVTDENSWERPMGSGAPVTGPTISSKVAH
mmetsp:Transcript_126805/g.405456  ORF Transcript_126805/g.405456 Transcript_126805/m.405456 type:complete len:152 (-) Transcript_126805:183-638(-)